MSTYLLAETGTSSNTWSIGGLTADITLDSTGLTTPQSLIFTTSGSNLALSTSGGVVNVSGNSATATNIAGGTANYVVYQSASGTTGFISPSTSGYVLTSNGTGSAPTFQPAASGGSLTATYVGYGSASNALTGTSDFTWTNSSQTLTLGAAGSGTAYIAGGYNLIIQSEGNNSSVTLNESGSAILSGSSEVELTAGSGGSLQFSVNSGGTTIMNQYGCWSFNGGTSYGTSGQVLTSQGNTSPPTWSTVTANTATNLAGGAAGSIPYQTASGTTAMLAAGTNGYVLTLSSGLPTWAASGGGGGFSAGTYTGTQSAPTVSGSGTNVLALNAGASALSITPSSTAYGAVYIGGDITMTSGDRNIIMWTAADSGGTSTARALTATGVVDSVVICPSNSASRALSSTGQLVVIGGGACFSSAATSVVIGYGAQTSSSNCTVIGANATAGSNTGCTIVGATNAANGGNTTSIGYNISQNGSSNSVFVGSVIPYNSPPSNIILIGNNLAADFQGEINICNAGFATAGDIHTSNFPLYQYTTSATATEISTGQGSLSASPATYIKLANNSSYIFNIDLVAQVKGGASACAGWQFQFMVQRGANAASTALVGSVNGTSAPIWSTGTVTGWAVAVTADTTNGRPAIKVTGAASTNISWVANVRMTKVGY